MKKLQLLFFATLCITVSHAAEAKDAFKPRATKVSFVYEQSNDIRTWFVDAAFKVNCFIAFSDKHGTTIKSYRYDPTEGCIIFTDKETQKSVLLTIDTIESIQKHEEKFELDLSGDIEDNFTEKKEQWLAEYNRTPICTIL